MIDVQGRPDDRGVHLEQVGVSQLRYPIAVLDREQAKQSTVAELTMSVGLPHHFKGTHMSRFIEVLEENRGEVTMHTIPQILRRMLKHLEADTARLEVRFPYFMRRSAPITGASGLIDYQCCFIGTSAAGANDFILSVRVPVTSLCPCSKEISDYGAHNQRGYIDLSVRTVPSADQQFEFVWIEELIEVAERSASSPVYPLLKRADERHVTMQAYDHPVFVEDMVRNVALELRADRRIRWFQIRAENHESIHNHNAFAETSWTRSE